MTYMGFDWRDNAKSRTILYAKRRLNPSRTIAITGETEYLNSFAGQCAVIVCANLISRMTANIALGFSETPIHPRLRWLGSDLHDAITSQLLEVGAIAKLRRGDAQTDDFVISLGTAGGNIVAKGGGWIAYVGKAAPPEIVNAADLENPTGAVLAAIIAAAQLFLGDFPQNVESVLIDAFTWRHNPIGHSGDFHRPDLGQLITIGLGSVGSSANYFLALFSAAFEPGLIDDDIVKVENLDRSPIFSLNDADNSRNKVDSIAKFLNNAGVRNIHSDAKALHESDLWDKREIGGVNALISAANEKDVRRHIECGYPPLQIYATTGKNWQTTLVRHIPIIEACSLCLFPSRVKPKPTACATAPASASTRQLDVQVDDAVPFLSFAAGFATAIEFFKASLPGYPFYAQRVVMTFAPTFTINHFDLPRRIDCQCRDRHQSVHRAALSHSKFSDLSKE